MKGIDMNKLIVKWGNGLAEVCPKTGKIIRKLSSSETKEMIKNG